MERVKLIFRLFVFRYGCFQISHCIHKCSTSVETAEELQQWNLLLRVSESVVQDLSSMTLFPQWEPCAEQGSTDGGRGGCLLGQPPGPAADGGLPSVANLTCYLDDDS